SFVLGHALSLKAMHGGKAKNDKIDAQKMAVLLRGGLLPQAYVYPADMRATRDLLRRRIPRMRKRAELLTHVHQPNSQYNLPDIARFPRVQDFVSSCRLVTCARESAGKRSGTSGAKIGNAYLQWAFSAAAVLFLRNHPAGHNYLARLAPEHGTGKAFTIFAHKSA